MRGGLLQSSTQEIMVIQTRVVAMDKERKCAYLKDFYPRKSA